MLIEVQRLTPTFGAEIKGVDLVCVQRLNSMGFSRSFLNMGWSFFAISRG